nr:Tn3 family transposase [Paenibacillus sp. SYP-B3998]
MTSSVWNTFYLGKASDLLWSKGTLREDLLKHMSPLGWEHINLALTVTVGVLKLRSGASLFIKKGVGL